jgi:hypothetical protein
VGLFVPIALLALPLLGIIVALYLLKLRRPSAPVASLHLWDSITRDREANSLWQRLNISVLLLLQIVALLLLILALARPWVPSAEPLGQNLVLVVDVSASMGSRDTPGGPSRLDIARDKAKQTIENLQQGGQAMLITSDNHAVVVVPSTDDRSRLRSALDALTPHPVPTDMVEAVRLAGAVAARQANSAVYIFSDGAFSSVADATEPIAGNLSFVPVGSKSENQGISAFAVDNGQSGLSLFLQISNSESYTVNRRLDLIADDAPWSARNVVLGPSGTEEIVIPDVPLGARVLGAELAGGDALAIDDRAWAVNRASVPANVLLVTSGNKFLELALSLLPTVTLYKVAPADYDPAATVNGNHFDLTVIDAGVPVTAVKTLPDTGGIMMFAPSVPNPLIEVSDTIDDPVLSIPAADPTANLANTRGDPLLRSVDLEGLHIAKASNLVLPTWGRAVLSSQSGPIVVAGAQNGRNVVALGFDLHDTDLALQPAFPLLIRNLVTYLLPLPAGGLPDQIPPGRTVSLEAVNSSVDHIVVENPDAQEQVFQVSGEQGRAAFGDTSRTGVYYVTQYSGDTIVAQEAFAVNLFSRDESLAGPNPKPGLPSAQEQTSGDGDQREGEGVFRRDVWPVVALVGVLVLLLEWVYAQRVVVRRALTEMRNRRALRELENEKI